MMIYRVCSVLCVLVATQHTGAGKSTVISLLTGLLQVTSGDALIYGLSLRRDMAAIRQITGICPQLNVLFPALTVVEHLRLFAGIKGIMCCAVDVAVDRVVSEVGLDEKRDAVSSALSGGQKRKLCLAIALIGDPKFLLLDEPTSGMDPHSRRGCWDMLQRCKVGRVVLLTTHFMDEADTLADRIVVISNVSNNTYLRTTDYVRSNSSNTCTYVCAPAFAKHTYCM